MQTRRSAAPSSSPPALGLGLGSSPRAGRALAALGGVTCSRSALFGATKSPGAILNSRRLARRALGQDARSHTRESG